jgi:hypothetical protein
MKPGGLMNSDRPILRLIAGALPSPSCCTDAVCEAATCMALPAATTCGDCLWFGICHPLGYARASQRECDFFPSKFVRDQEPPR